MQAWLRVTIVLADRCRHDTIDMQRWVWLHVRVIDPTKITQQYYVPEYVVRHIPTYKRQLDEQLASIKGDKEPVICDLVARDTELIGKTIRYLASGYLYPLNAGSSTCKADLDDLVTLYQFSTALSIKRLETAVLHHIDTFEELPLAIFLAFARSYYKMYGADAQDTSLSELIKRKLAAFLQHMIDTKTKEEIKNEGGILGQQLIEVLLEERSLRATQWKLNSSDIPIKIEDDEDEDEDEDE
jgi:hypothetical protein